MLSLFANRVFWVSTGV